VPSAIADEAMRSNGYVRCCIGVAASIGVPITGIRVSAGIRVICVGIGIVVVGVVGISVIGPIATKPDSESAIVTAEAVAVTAAKSVPASIATPEAPSAKAATAKATT